MDRQELRAHLARAAQCARDGDFDCATAAIAQARKYQQTSRDRHAIAQAAQDVELARQRVMINQAQRRYARESSALEARSEATQRDYEALARQGRDEAARDAERADREQARAAAADSGPTAAQIILGQVQRNAAEARASIATINRNAEAAREQGARNQAAQQSAQAAQAEHERRQREDAERRAARSSSTTQSTAARSSSQGGSATTIDSVIASAGTRPQGNYVCTEIKGFTDPLNDKSQFDSICQRVQAQAREWASKVGTGDWAYSNYKVTGIDACTIGKVYGSLIVKVNMTHRSDRPCNTGADGLSK